VDRGGLQNKKGQAGRLNKKKILQLELLGVAQGN
jgi:hypothetical protein